MHAQRGADAAGRSPDTSTADLVLGVRSVGPPGARIAARSSMRKLQGCHPAAFWPDVGALCTHSPVTAVTRRETSGFSVSAQETPFTQARHTHDARGTAAAHGNHVLALRAFSETAFLRLGAAEGSHPEILQDFWLSHLLFHSRWNQKSPRIWQEADSAPSALATGLPSLPHRKYQRGQRGPLARHPGVPQPWLGCGARTSTGPCVVAGRLPKPELQGLP